MKKRKLSDIMLFSDIDGTLLRTGDAIPRRNIEAVRRFTAKGGHFSLATGRDVGTVRALTREVGANMPTVLLNGCCAYDMEAEEVLWARLLPSHAVAYVKQVCADQDFIAALVFTPEGCYAVTKGRGIDEGLRHVDGGPLIEASIEEISGLEWYKAVFLCPPKDMRRLCQYINTQAFDDVAFVQSSANLLEMLPQGVSKATAIRFLAGTYGVDMSNVAAIGDHMNDLQMLQAVGLSATVADGQPEIKAVAQRIVGECYDGAVADFIEYLESICE